MRSPKIISVITALIAWLPSAALADVVTSYKPSTVVGALQNAGYKASLAKSDDGDPLITTAAGGNNIRILFLGCENNLACDAIEIVGFWTCPESALDCKNKIDEFNATENPVKLLYVQKSKIVITYLYQFYDEKGTSEALFVRVFENFATHNQEFSDLFR
jgi:hypothetical protein